MRIALCGHYGAYNLGDEAQRQVIREALVSWGHEVTEYGITGPAEGIRLLQGNESAMELEGYDAVVFGGGMVFLTQPSPIWFERHFRELSTPVHYFCVGTETLSADAIDLYKHPLERAASIVWRSTVHESSPDLPGTSDGVDLAYGLPSVEPKDPEPLLVVISGVGCPWLTHLPEVATNLGVGLAFMPLCTHANGSDLMALAEIPARSVEVLLPLSHRSPLLMLSTAKYVLTSRRHGAIFAALAGVMPVIVGEHPRLKVVAEDLGETALPRESSVEDIEVALRMASQHRGRVDLSVVKVRLANALEGLRARLEVTC
jgi:hypothetical protein